MAGEISLTNGATTVTVPIKLTVSKTNAVLLRYCAARGIPTEGRTAAEIGEDVLRSILRYVKDVSKDQQRVELLAQQRQQLEETISTDNDLFTEN